MTSTLRPGTAIADDRLRTRFDPRRNGLNALRLLLAVGVVLWHAFPLTGRRIAWAPLHQVLATLSVDGFFAISGYLILGSWLARPDLLRYLAARVLRILPGYWASLLLTAAVIAPVGILLAGRAVPAGFPGGAAAYVLDDLLLAVHRYGIAGTPVGVPYPGVWNGSIWTLWYEFVCYLAIAALGVLGLLRRRHTVLVVFAAALGFALVQALVAPGLLSGPLGRLSLAPADTARLGLMFAAGMVVQRYAGLLRVRASWLWAAALIAAVAAFLPLWEPLAALPIAYLLIAGGSLIRSDRLQLRQDLSYGMYVYAFPVQQVLAGTVLVALPALAFGVLATLLTVPFAALSWFAVEKPAKRLIRLVPRRAAASTVGAA